MRDPFLWVLGCLALAALLLTGSMSFWLVMEALK
jgi:hypothetical protein